MNPCSWEERIVAGVRDHPLDAESLQHLKGCEQCQQAAFIARILIEEGQEAEQTAWARLPTADRVLARAALFVPIAAEQNHAAARRLCCQ